MKVQFSPIFLPLFSTSPREQRKKTILRNSSRRFVCLYVLTILLPDFNNVSKRGTNQKRQIRRSDGSKITFSKEL